ncbi:MAG: phosphoribosylamine--glycine ligase [Symbiobacteriaceae bacterium]|nr:phosphoribosylamine--glycine ligase [Symbiobacteriaceae bacterium]
MKILVIGSGGREHALCWKIAQSPLCSELYVAPGNSGMADVATLLPISVQDQTALLRAALDLQIDLTVVGPDDPLAEGLVDLFTANGLLTFGPNRQAAQLEWSKSFSRAFMLRHHIPAPRRMVVPHTANIRQALAEFTSPEQREAPPHREEAPVANRDENAQLTASYPVVLKANGLAAGKGVVIAPHPQAAEDAFFALVSKLGKAADEVILEEFLVGRELSLLLFCDGTHMVPLLPSEDHKQLFEGDQGPNTGGMGAIAPLPWLRQQDYHQIMEQIVQPTLKGMLAEGIDFRGVLFIGLMLTATGAKVLEYNARFGDPETQVLLPLLESDLVSIMLACCQGKLSPDMVKFSSQAAAAVVLASPGYPDNPVKGLPITGLDLLEPHIKIFYAGISHTQEGAYTNGGRVLTLVATADSLAAAQEQVYRAVASISFEGMHYRKDIGSRP